MAYEIKNHKRRLQMRNNGQDAGILWSIPFTTRIGKLLNQG